MFTTLEHLIAQEARIAIPPEGLAPDADLYALGLTPYTAIRLLLAVERAFGVEFPRESLNRRTMATIASISRCVRETQTQTTAQTAATFNFAAAA